MYILYLLICQIGLVLSDKFSTKAIHGNNIITPICLGTTFTQITPGINLGKNDTNSHGLGYIYSRLGNPTRGELENKIALLENAKYACAFSSGMASISAIIHLLKPNDHIIAMDNLYGGTLNFFNRIANESNGIQFTFLDCNDFNLLEKSIKKNTKLIWIETLSNPLLKTVDIKTLSKITKKYNCLLVVDSTFTSPYLINPLDIGADIVLHSATKFIGGHSDLLMGMIVCNNDTLINKFRDIQTHLGAVPSPFECYLALRGLKTLHLRMETSQKNALQIAKFLESHPRIEKVIYPGLKSFEYFKLAKNQFRGYGSMISFYLKGDVEKFLTSLKIFKLAVSLGSVESLICCPILMTHITIPNELRESKGIKNNLIRMSVGIEDIQDLIQDLKNTLDFN